MVDEFDQIRRIALPMRRAGKFNCNYPLVWIELWLEGRGPTIGRAGMYRNEPTVFPFLHLWLLPFVLDWNNAGVSSVPSAQGAGGLGANFSEEVALRSF
ncbi:hypothetical protein ASG42_14810 [Rhizobium sp. Leaf391]|uniref:hypothetical protein n=1 Tax=Rhizobium sp. Leaf391 TaxID=1736360 RepID=UPI00071333E6|nr:hypothetical protein [Rhizobium sp. Leaf391]KQS89027.1 hypothetical protein ASG42_14810 [Rhizobium sp. Leaf391]